MTKHKKRQPNLGDRDETLVYALAGESDRGCSLVVAEFTSDALAEYLRAKFTKERTNKKLQDKLLSGPLAPLATFSMRANICRAFGLIGPKTFKAVENLRAIRNRAAHCTSFSLTDADNMCNIQDLTEYVDETIAADLKSELANMWGSVGEDFGEISEARQTMLHASFSLQGHIYSRGFYLAQGTDYQSI